MEIRNVRSYPLALDGQVVKPGDTLTVPDHIGRACLAQPANWRKVTRRVPPTVLAAAPAEPDPTTTKE